MLCAVVSLLALVTACSAAPSIEIADEFSSSDTAASDSDPDPGESTAGEPELDPGDADQDPTSTTDAAASGSTDNDDDDAVADPNREETNAGEPAASAADDQLGDGDASKVDDAATVPTGDNVASLVTDCESTATESTATESTSAGAISARATSDMACDILLSISMPDSDLEAIALGCGGRGAAFDSFCTEGIEVAGPDSIWFSDDSPGIGDIVAGCEAGDMTSCDFLYFRSDYDSELEQVGNSCGGRIDIAIPDCRTALATQS